MKQLQAIALWVLLLVPATAWPHAGALPQSLDVLRFPGNANALSLETTFGVVVSPDSEQWRWICHETIIRDMTAVIPRYSQNRDGVLLAHTNLLSDALADSRESVYRSADGCDWLAPIGLTDAIVADVAFDTEDGNRALAALADLEPEALNGIRFSTDAGASWTPATVEADDRIFQAVQFAPGGTGFAWATAARFSVLQAWVARSSDSGESWESHPFEFEVDGSTQVLVDIAAASSDGNTVWVRVDAPTSDHLLRSTDAGVSFSEVFSVEDIIHDTTLDPSGGLWAITEESGLHRAENGIDFSLVSGAPRAFGLDYDERGLLVAANIWHQDYSMAVSADGLTFDSLISRNFDELLGPLECPEDSQSTQFCDPAWTMLTNQLGRGDDDDSAEGDDDSAEGDDDSTEADDDDSAEGDDDTVDDSSNGACECATASPGSLGESGEKLLLVFLLTLVARRKRTLESCQELQTNQENDET